MVSAGAVSCAPQSRDRTRAPEPLPQRIRTNPSLAASEPVRGAANSNEPEAGWARTNRGEREIQTDPSSLGPKEPDVRAGLATHATNQPRPPRTPNEPEAAGMLAFPACAASSQRGAGEIARAGRCCRRCAHRLTRPAATRIPRVPRTTRTTG
jgi:hypothetical protein